MREIIGAALRRQRIAVVVALVVGLGAAVLRDWADRLDDPLALLSAAPLVLFIGIVLRHLRWRPSTAELRVDEGARAFFAPPRAQVGFAPAVVGFFAYQAADSLLRPSDDRWPFSVVAGLAMSVLGLVLWRRVPGVELTPDGIAHRRTGRQWFVPWAALDPAGPVGFPREPGILALPIVRPELVISSGPGRRGESVVVRDVDTAPTEIAGAIRHYLTHPGARAAIGTAEEYARLRAALGGGG